MINISDYEFDRITEKVCSFGVTPDQQTTKHILKQFSSLVGLLPLAFEEVELYEATVHAVSYETLECLINLNTIPEDKYREVSVYVIKNIGELTNFLLDN